jgi:general stress protein 26
MAKEPMLENYEDVTAFGLSPEREQELLERQTECVFMWSTKNAEPVGVIMSFVAASGKIWLTSAEQRKRVAAIQRNPNSSVCITSTGTKLGGGKTITYKGTSVVHKGDRRIADWYYRALAERLYGPMGPETVQNFVRFLDSPARVILEFTPTRRISFDGDRMAAATPWLKGGWRAT